MPPFVRRIVPLAVAIALLSACGGGGGGGGGGGSCGAILALGPEAAEPNEVIVMLRRTDPNVPVTILPADLLTRGLTVIDQFGSRPIWRLGVAADDTVAEARGRLTADLRVAWAEPNLQTQSPESRRCSVWAIGQASDFQAQWAPRAMRLAAAHDASAPVHSRGVGVRVAVLDTGIDYDHPAFIGRISAGRDFVNPESVRPEERGGAAANPGFGHGTHVAGLVLLAAPQAQIMPVRVLDPNGQGNAWVLAEALAWAVDPDGDPNTDDGAHVVNFSLGSLLPTQLLKIATQLASCDLDDDDDDAYEPNDRIRCGLRRGAVVIAAAGNSGDAEERQYPAAEIQPGGFKGALAVTASNSAGRRASFGNHGPWVQIAAPGEGITSTIPDGQYGTWSGTSMAAPLAAGVAALVIASGQGPASGDPDRLLRTWAPEHVVQRLRTGSAPMCPDFPPTQTPTLTQIDALGALDNAQAPRLACQQPR